MDPGVSGARAALGMAIADALGAGGLEPPAARRFGTLISEIVPDGSEHPGWHRLRATIEAGALEARMRPPSGSVSEPGGPEVAPGLRRADEPATERWGRRRGNEIELVIRLGGPSMAASGPPTSALPAERDGFLLGALAAVLRGSGDADLDGVAKGIGAAAAAGAAVTFTGRRGGPPQAPGELADAFVEFQRAIGGDWSWTRTDTGPVVLSNRVCPFGPLARANPGLCGITRSFLQSLADGAMTGAEVDLDRRLAVGDAQCRLTLDLGRAVVARRPDPPPAIELSLRLPRRRSSVSVARHLVRGALETAGSSTGSTDDVVLALSEACANAVRHAGRGAEYTLVVGIDGPWCRIDVRDAGQAFTAPAAVLPGADAEGGRGLALMRALMDEVTVDSAPETGTHVRMDKRLGIVDAGAPSAPG